MTDSDSRYARVGTAQHQAADGTETTYFRRRLVPRAAEDAAARASAQHAIVGHADRLDLVAARLIGDPLQFWRLADANAAMNPFDLVEPGRTLIAPPLHFPDRTA